MQTRPEAIDAGADVVLLDNMTDEQMASIVDAHQGRCLFEASGNLDAERIARLPALGIDVASMGGRPPARWADPP